MNKFLLILSIVSLVGCLPMFQGSQTSSKQFQNISSEISGELLDNNFFPKVITSNSSQYILNYKIKPELNDYLSKLLHSFGYLYSAIVVIDNETGAIIGAQGFDGKTRRKDMSLAFTPSHPAASIFKIVSAANLIHNEDFDDSSKVTYSGRGGTLYRYQVLKPSRRWKRRTTFRSAFGFSNNVVFAKETIFNSSALDLYSLGLDFGFNEPLFDEMKIPASKLSYPNSPYNLGEIASGFTLETQFSPVHGAYMASVIANNGAGKKPYLVSSITDEKGFVVWRPLGDEKRILNVDVAEEVQELMNYVVVRGTGRGFYRRMKPALKKSLDLGGKTGTLTGGEPHGKHDLFVAYAKPKDPKAGKGISLCVMQIHNGKWRVKSTFLAKKVVEYYYSKVFSVNTAFLSR